jgi:type I restriction enzyme, S subunit
VSDTQAPSTEWSATTFGELVANVSIGAKKVPKGEYLESGRFPVVDQGQQFIGGYSDDPSKVISEDLPLIVFGDHTRAFKYLDQPFVPGADGVKVLKPLGVNPKWLFHAAHALEFPNKGYARHFQHLKSAKLSVPPIPRQLQVVAEVEMQFTRLDAGMSALQRVQANLKRYRAAVLKAACEGRLVPIEAELAKAEGRAFESGEELLARILEERRKRWTGRGKYKEPARPNAVHPARLPDGWAWATVEQLVREPLCNGVSVAGSLTPPGVRSLRLSAMSGHGFDYSDIRYLPLPDDDVSDLRIQEADFFVSRGNGSLHLVGRGTRAQEPPTPTIFPDTMIRLRLTAPITHSRWVSTIWPSRDIRSQVESRVKTTAGIYKVSQPQIESIRVPVPPLAEQTRIVAEIECRFGAIDNVEAMAVVAAKRSTRLRRSVLDSAMSGRT